MLEIAQSYVTNSGYTPEDAKAKAKQDVAGYETVSQFNEFYRTEFRHQWVVDFPDLARTAFDQGYFNPDTPEREFLVVQGGGVLPEEEEESSSVFGSRISIRIQSLG